MRTPKPVAGRDPRSLTLAPLEGYVLARIDGRLTERDIVEATGLGAEVVAAALDRLAGLGAISLDPSAFAPAQTLPSAPGPAAPAPAARPPELDEEVDLAPEKKARILDLFQRLNDLSHYEILGVTSANDKKQIKSAYYQLAPEFHPDKYFRKNLGSFKHRIEALFSRITLAHDVLTSKEKRAEYDDYLAQTQQNRALAAFLDGHDVEGLDGSIDAGQARARDSIPDAPPPPPPSAPEAARPSYTPPPIDKAAIDRERRELLARKLMGGRPFAARARPSSEPGPPRPMITSRPPVGDAQAGAAPRSASSSPPLSTPPGVSERPADGAARPTAAAEAAAQGLRARYATARDDAKSAQAARHAVLGKQALADGDLAGAANQLRIAASLAPDDAEIQRLAAEARKNAAAALADGYEKQAEYEAGQTHWGDASLSYARVCAGRPTDARAHERVAFATLKSSGNTRRAVEFARRAVELAPTEADFHVTLARAYLAAGLDVSAAGELERARELAPNDARIKGMIQELRTPAQHKPKVG